jgi:hypothetical protein
MVHGPLETFATKRDLFQLGISVNKTSHACFTLTLGLQAGQPRQANPAAQRTSWSFRICASVTSACCERLSSSWLQRCAMETTLACRSEPKHRVCVCVCGGGCIPYLDAVDLQPLRKLNVLLLEGCQPRL